VHGATVVLDIDETVLRTEGRQVLPHPLGLAVYREVQRLGVALVYVTARRDNLRSRLWAMQQLHMLGVGTYAELRLMPHGTTDVRAYKAAQRRELAAQGHRIVLNMGDQWTDFAAVDHPPGNGHYAWTAGEHELCLKLPHSYV
jgi:predicted secreted acid phosphatase